MIFPKKLKYVLASIFTKISALQCSVMASSVDLIIYVYTKADILRKYHASKSFFINVRV